MTRLTIADQDHIAALVRDAAAAEILPRFQRPELLDTSEKKGPLDLVTAADLAMEARLTDALGRAFPGAVVVGEEAIGADPSLRDAMDNADLAFVIDPVDGTWNFAHGLPLFGVIVAVLHRGVPIFGLIHDPVMDNWMIASAEVGARQVWGDGRQRGLATSTLNRLPAMSGFMHFFLMPQVLQDRLAPALPAFARVQAIRCSAHEYRALAQGSVEFCLSGVLNPWDHAAGVLLCQSAGGHVAMLDGQPYSTHPREGYLLSAGSRAAWETARDHLAPYLGSETVTRPHREATAVGEAG